MGCLVGRRRRAIAEQRRAEQQNWDHFLHERDEEVYVAPPRPPVSRRQLRRASRRLAQEDWEPGMLEEDEDNIDMALGIAINLCPLSKKVLELCHVSTC